MDGTGLGERIIGGIVAFVILFFCAYFIGTALEGLERDTQPQAMESRAPVLSGDHVIIK